MTTALVPVGLSPRQLAARLRLAKYGPANRRKNGRCRHGHLMTAANTRTRPNGQTVCRACGVLRRLRWAQTHRGKCRRGHLLTDANRCGPRGRDCRACQRLAEDARARLDRLRAEVMAAHPDRGGSLATFTAAYRRYQQERRA